MSSAHRPCINASLRPGWVHRNDKLYLLCLLVPTDLLCYACCDCTCYGFHFRFVIGTCITLFSLPSIQTIYSNNSYHEDPITFHYIRSLASLIMSLDLRDPISLRWVEVRILPILLQRVFWINPWRNKLVVVSNHQFRRAGWTVWVLFHGCS